MPDHSGHYHYIVSLIERNISCAKFIAARCNMLYGVASGIDASGVVAIRHIYCNSF